jgi:hypothetical protein
MRLAAYVFCVVELPDRTGVFLLVASGCAMCSLYLMAERIPVLLSVFAVLMLGPL